LKIEIVTMHFGKCCDDRLGIHHRIEIPCFGSSDDKVPDCGFAANESNEVLVNDKVPLFVLCSLFLMDYLCIAWKSI